MDFIGFFNALGPVFAILNVILIPVHILLLRRSFRIADNFKVEHGLPPSMVAANMKLQRDGDKSAYRQVFICAGICFFLAGTTLFNIYRFLIL